MEEKEFASSDDALMQISSHLQKAKLLEQINSDNVKIVVKLPKIKNGMSSGDEDKGNIKHLLNGSGSQKEFILQLTPKSERKISSILWSSCVEIYGILLMNCRDAANRLLVKSYSLWLIAKKRLVTLSEYIKQRVIKQRRRIADKTAALAQKASTPMIFIGKVIQQQTEPKSDHTDSCKEVEDHHRHNHRPGLDCCVPKKYTPSHVVKEWQGRIVDNQVALLRKQIAAQRRKGEGRRRKGGGENEEEEERELLELMQMELVALKHQITLQTHVLRQTRIGCESLVEDDTYL